jgi:phosphopantothenoylcysteine decarboxylase/phosphopantothenate--cysteine ligase
MATESGSGVQRAPHVVLGVSGGIAAYKACELLRRLTESGHDVTVVPTAAALEFVGAPTWAALSGRPVATDVWTGVHEVPHVRIGRSADLVVVAPATADLLARAAHGLADDLLTSTLLTATCPVVFAPAMHTEMWEHPATAANVATLRHRGSVVVEPAEGRLTGADTGKGRFPDPVEIFELVRDVLARSGAANPLDLAGHHHQPGGQHRLDRHPAGGVTGQQRVQDRVADLVGDLVRVPLGHGLGGEKASSHVVVPLGRSVGRLPR